MAYECIAACRIGSSILSVDLARPLGQLIGVTGFDVNLQIEEALAAALRKGLKQLLGDHLEILADAEHSIPPDPRKNRAVR